MVTLVSHSYTRGLKFAMCTKFGEPNFSLFSVIVKKDIQTNRQADNNNSNINNEVHYCIQIAHQHSCHKMFLARVVDPVKISSKIVWSPCKIWLLFLIHVHAWSQEIFDRLVPPLYPDALRWGMSDPLETSPSLQVLQRQICCSRSNRDPLEMFDSSCPAFQGHCLKCLSRSLKITQWNWNGSIGYYLILAFHSNYRPILHCFWDKRRYTQNCPTPVYLTAIQ